MADIVKAGWLLKQSSFLKRWKRKWFSLSSDGYFRCFESPNDHIAKTTVLIPNEVIAIKTGHDVEARPPDNGSSDNLIKIIFRDDSWLLSAEDVDDMLAWQIALEQARVITHVQTRPNNPQIPAYLNDAIAYNPNNGYPMYYRGNYRGRYPTRIIHTPEGPLTVVYVNDGGYYGRYPGYGYGRYPGYGYGCRGGNVALGALTGAAIASTFMWPFWFPLFWW